MIAYIDESGYPIPSDTNAISVLSAVCVFEQSIRELTHKMYLIKNDIYGKQTEIKSTSLFNAKTIEKNRTKNKEYAERMIGLVHDTCAVFAVIMNRPTFLPYTEKGQLPVQYTKLLQRINGYCCHVNHLAAICVFDETDDGRDKLRAEGFNNFLFRTGHGKACGKILVSPLFVSSSVTTTVELADICAGLVRNIYQLGLHRRNPQNDYEEWITDLFQRVRETTFNQFWRGKIVNGIYVMPNKCFKVTPSINENAPFHS